MKIRRLLFPVFLLVILGGMTWIMTTNYQRVDELQKAGKRPITVATPGVDGEDGRSAYQVWLDNGYKGSELEFLTWLRGERGAVGAPGNSIRGERGEKGEKGDTGAQGVAGPAGADGVSIKGDKGETGAVGAKGEQGIQGVPGASGRTPVIGCVIRTVNNVPVNYIAWKYSDEADSAYRNLYRVPSWAQAEGCVEVAA